MTKYSLPPIKEVISGTQSEDGQLIHLNVKLDDGRTVSLTCPHHRLGHVVTSMQAAAQVAKEARTKSNPLEGKMGDVDAAEPFRVKALQVGSAIGHELVAVRVHTEQEISVDLAFPLEQVPRLIEALEDALERNRETSKRKPN
jgi:hypothetical protein